MIAQSIIPRGFDPSHECWMWLHSEHRRVLQLERKAYDNAYDNGNFKHAKVLLVFESMLWNALMECTEAHCRATDKHIAEDKAFLAAIQNNSEIPF